MSFRARLGSACAVLLCAAPVWAQEPPAPREIPDAGFWPTRKMIDRAIQRITEEMSGRYEFDEQQLAAIQDVIRERVPVWMQENRPEIQTLMNEYFEALLDGKPPSSEEVADWANRALPLLNSFVDVMEDTSQGMMAVMNDEQAVMMQGDMAMFRVGTSAARQKFAQWADGEFDPRTDWPGSDAQREHEAAEQRQLELEAELARRDAEADERLRRGATSAPASPEEATSDAANAGPIDEAAGAAPGGDNAGRAAATARPSRPAPDGPKDDMTYYVEAFIRRYELRDDQQQKAYQCLKQAQEERKRHEKRAARELEETEKALRTAKTDEERETAQKAFDKARQPLAKAFDRLKDRLGALPTRKQRADAERRTATQPGTHAREGEPQPK